ncbi:MAG: DUF192 domain-containing protein [Verrucomicrobiota bacterium]|nr:DUF192 domain-containing protein [Limisphaera sp.]MDW8382020.1 DUF192 domain-containing protein [Verrucomicrobiota bacterium]
MGLGFWLAGCGERSPTPPHGTGDVDPQFGHLLRAQPPLPTVRLWLGDQVVLAEVARRPVEIATGMMFRDTLPEGHGMLFVFPDASRRSFWMRNCRVPLSAAYIDPDGVILEIIDLEPLNEEPAPSQSEHVQFVLEVPRNWFARHRIGPGTLVRTERGSLRQTFFGVR